MVVPKEKKNPLHLRGSKIIKYKKGRPLLCKGEMSTTGEVLGESNE